MTQDEYLAPVGNECGISSKIEALRIFTRNKLFGDIKFGVAHTEDGDSPCWLLIPVKGHAQPMPAFITTCFSPVTSFSELTLDSCFTWRGKYYQLIHDDCLELTIREMICFPTEADVYGYSQCQEFGDVDIYAVKMYRIGKTREFLFPSWYIQLPEGAKHTAAFVPMFMDDMLLMQDINTNELNWEFMSPGDTFIHDKKLWKLDHNKKVGLFINEMPFIKLNTSKNFRRKRDR